MLITTINQLGIDKIRPRSKSNVVVLHFCRRGQEWRSHETGTMCAILTVRRVHPKISPMLPNCIPAKECIAHQHIVAWYHLPQLERKKKVTDHNCERKEKE